MKNARITQLFSFLTKDPTDAFTRYSIAYEYKKLDEHAEASKHFAILIEEHPDYLGAYYHYGASLLELDNREKAELVFEEGMKKARQARDTHALAELQTAYNNMMYEED
ncbi:MAG: tetratricopeptide repeat protein [Bacteroidia bacterium]